MYALNKIIFSGHLGQEPRVRQVNDGTPVLNLSVAMSKRRKGEDITYWWDVTMFGERGLKLHDMLRKGSHVIVEGEYGEREYTDRDGNHRVQREVLANNIYLLDKRQDGQERQAYGARQEQGGNPFGARQEQGGNPFGNQRSRPPPAQQRGFGGNHRDDFAPGGRAQRTFGGAAAAPPYSPPPEDDDIPF